MGTKRKTTLSKETEKMTLLGLDDMLPFECKACGGCCKGRPNIILTPYDIFRLARHFSLNMADVFDRYCDYCEEPNSRLLLAKIAPRPLDKGCPFLKNGKCSVHPVKPILCRIFPLGRVSKPTDDESVYYLKGITKCLRTEKFVTVRDWVGDAASDESERAWVEWSDAISRIVMLLRDKLDALAPDERANTLENIFLFLYAPYEAGDEFVPQFNYNVDKLCSIMETDFDVLKNRVGGRPQRTEGKS
jgi:Fe-S-cluster containining protein